jgi:rhodanese-related sulfurtransferase
MSFRQMMDAANAAVPRITPEEAKVMIARGNTLIVDVREMPEVVRSGKIAGAALVPCSVLESRADPETPDYDDKFEKGKTILLYCAAGERSALSGKMLKEMGYNNVYNLGSFRNWVDSGGPVEAISR